MKVFRNEQYSKLFVIFGLELMQMHTNWAILSDDQFIRIGFKLNQYLHWLIEKWKQLNNDYIFSRGYYMMKFKLIIRYWMMFSVHGISIGAYNSKKKNGSNFNIFKTYVTDIYRAAVEYHIFLYLYLIPSISFW